MVQNTLQIVKKVSKSWLFLLLFFGLSANASGHNFDLSRTDTAAHLGISYGLTLTGAMVLKRLGMEKTPALLTSILLTSAIYTLKELSDPVFSGGDMVANGIGTVGAALTFHFTTE